MSVEIRDKSLFKASNKKAILMLLCPAVLLAISLLMSLSGYSTLYYLGQVFMAFFFLQCFILLHECAHMNFFKSKLWNQVIGYLFGFLSLIPFYSWKEMHNLHHRWTGWRDKDPTTEKTAKAPSSAITRFVANLSWFLFVPIFFLVYMFSNYWNVGKMKRFLSKAKWKKAVKNVLLSALIYISLIFLFKDFLLLYVLPAFVLSLVFKELVILTQHTHIFMPLSDGDNVEALPYKDQIKYTRSFYLQPWFEKHFLFNFNLHELHHAFPGAPAYSLQSIQLGLKKEPKYIEWLKQAKSMKGEDFIFKTSKDTGRKF